MNYVCAMIGIKAIVKHNATDMQGRTRSIIIYQCNGQSSPFHVFHWWRAYHVRLWKLDRLLRIGARERQCIIHR